MTPYASSFANSLLFSIGLSAMGCATSQGLMPPVDEPGLTVIGAPTVDLTATLTSAIERDYHVSSAQIGDVHSFPTDLDNDPTTRDLAGTALFRVEGGRRFKSIIFLMHQDGTTRFLEANGARFNPSTGGSVLSCDNKPAACPDTFERATAQIRRARFTVSDMDPTRAGPEVVIPYDDGRYGLINSLELFASR